MEAIEYLLNASPVDKIRLVLAFILLLPLTAFAAARDIDLPVTSLDLGSVQVGSSGSATFSIGNVGGASLNVSSITSDSPEFTCSPVSATIPGGDTELITVTFAPVTAEVKTATVTIVSNDPDEPSVTVALTGTGTTPLEPEIDLPTTSVDIGEVTMGASGSASFTIENEGLTELTVSGVTSDNPLFTVSPTSAAIPAGQDEEIVVTFSPTSAGNRSATITIASNDSDEPSSTVNVTAKGMPGGEINLSVSNLDIGDVVVGESGTAVFLVENQGSSDLTVSGITSDNPLFTVSPVSFTISSSQSREVAVTFSPSSPGSRSAGIAISSDDSDEPVLNVEATGNGVTAPPPAEPEISLSTSSLDLGAVTVGESGSAFFTVTNEGTADLAVSSISSDNPLFTVSPVSFTISSSQSREVTVTFSPSSPGSRSAEIAISSDDSDEPVLTLEATGSGILAPPATEPVTQPAVEPEIALSTTSVDLGAVTVGESGSASFAVTNEGTADLAVSSISSDNPLFTVSPGSFTLAPLRSREVKVTFSPSSAGSQSAGITISSNDSDEPDALVSVRGIGDSPKLEVSETNIDFGDVLRGDSGRAVLTIGNTGSFPIVVSSIAIDNAVFSVDIDSLSVPAKESRRIEITFTPDEPGTYAATLGIFIENGKEPGLDVQLGGNCVLPPSPRILLSSYVVDLGVVEVGGTARSSFEIINNGTAELVIDSIIPASKAFKVDNNVARISPGNSLVVNISFSPDAAGLWKCPVSIANNASGIRGMRAEGAAREKIENPAASFTVERVQIEPDSKETRGSESFYIRNNTGEVLSVDRMSCDLTFVEIMSESTSLSPGDSCRITVAVDAGSPGVYESLISVTTSTFSDGPQTHALVLYAKMKNPEPVLKIRNSSINLGEAFLGTTSSISQVFTNMGDADLNLELQISGNSSFKLSGNNLRIPPGAADSVEILFEPDTTGEFTGSLEIKSNDSSKGNISIGLTASGIPVPEPDILLLDRPGGDPLILDEKYRLGDLKMGRVAAFAFTVCNEGGDNLQLKGIAADNELFTLQGDDFQVPPKRYSEFSIEFVSTEPGNYSTIVSITSNDPDEEVIRFRLFVDVVAEPSGELALSADEIQFGEAAAGDTVIRHLLLRNSGDGPLYLNSRIECPSCFALKNDSLSIPAGDSALIEIRFSPDSSGYFSAPLDILTGDPSPEEFRIDLFGTCPAASPVETTFPFLELSCDSVVFNDLRVGDLAKAEVILSNTGNADLVINSARTGNGLFSVYGMPDSILPGSSAALTVGFKAESSGAKETCLLINSNDSLNPEKSIRLRASVLDEGYPKIELNERKLLLNEHASNSGGEAVLKIANTGESNLVIEEIRAPSPDFIIHPVSAVVAPGGEIKVNISLRNKLSGAYSGSLTIISNDSEEDSLNVELNFSVSGEGKDCSLEQNFPNPFNPSTTIAYSLDRDIRVVLNIYDLRGKLVRVLVDRNHQPGSYSVNWDGRDKMGRPVSSGVYFYKIQAGNFSRTRKMMILK